MKDIISIILDCVYFLMYACSNVCAMGFGIIGIATQQVELMTTAILLYLFSNTFEEEINKRLEDHRKKGYYKKWIY